MNNQAGLLEDCFEHALGPHQLVLDHDGLLTFLKNVIKQEDERLRDSLSAHSLRINDQLRLGHLQEGHKLRSLEISGAPDHEDGTV